MRIRRTAKANLRRTMRVLSKLAQYATGTVLLAVASLLFIPALIGAVGLTTWGAVAVGQAIAGIGAIVVGYGWGVSGPAAVARASAGEARREYIDSLRTRSVLLILVALAATALTFLIPGLDAPVASVATLPTLAAALTANFFYVGRSQPGQLLLFETLPRVAGTLLATAALRFWGVDVIAALLLQLAGVVVGIALSSSYVLLATIGAPRQPIATLRVSLLERRHGLAAVLWIACYSSAPILILTALSPSSVGAFGVIDKLIKQITAASSPFMAVLQGWVPRAARSSLTRRTSIVSLLAVGVSFVSLALTPAVFLMLQWMGGGEYVPSVAEALFAALCVGLFLSQGLLVYAAMAPLGLLKAAARVSGAGSIVGVILVAVCSASMGVLGALVGLAAGLLIQTVVQFVIVLNATRGSRGSRYRSAAVVD